MILIHWRKHKLINQYLFGTLSSTEKESLENHFSSCSDCRALLEKERELLELIKSSTRLIEPRPGALERAEAVILNLPKHNITSSVPPSRKLNFQPYVRWSPAIALVFILILITSIVHYRSKSIFTPIQLSSIQGQGLSKLSPQSQQWIKLDNKSSLEPGDQIHTDEFTKSSIAFGKIGSVWLNRNTEVTLDVSTSSALSILKGDIFVAVNVKPVNFRVKTPAGIVQVFGTQFAISVDSVGLTKVYCSSDTVYFSNPQGKVILPAGYQSSAIPDHIPSAPVEVDVDSIIQWKNQFDKYTSMSPAERILLAKQLITEGLQLDKQEKNEEAKSDFTEAIFLNPGSPFGYYNLGRTNLKIGEYEKATTAFVRSIARDSSDYDSYYQLGESLMELKLYPQAEQTLLNLIKLHPNSHADPVLLGNVYLLSDKFDEARKFYQQGIQLGADTCLVCRSYIHGGFAEMARINKDYLSAQMEIDNALAGNKYRMPGLVYAEFARFYLETGDAEKEKLYWGYYLYVSPNGTFNQQAKERLKLLSPLNLKS